MTEISKRELHLEIMVKATVKQRFLDEKPAGMTHSEFIIQLLDNREK